MKKVKVIKVYDADKTYKNGKTELVLRSLIEFLIGVLIYAVVLSFASTLFKGFYIETFGYAILASLLLMGLNVTIKPLLIYLTLPITILSLGILYPIVNVILLKLCGWFLGTHFIVEGIIVPFFIAIFISLMKLILEALILNPIKGAK